MAQTLSPPYTYAHDTQTPPDKLWYHYGPRLGSAGWRFLQAFALASAIYLLLVGLSERIFGVPRYERPYWYPKARPNPADGEILSCNLGWTDAKSSGSDRTVTASTTLPIGDASTLFFRSTGSHSSGTIRFITAEPSTLARDDLAIADFKVKYRDPEAWDIATVCIMKRSRAEYGIGIYTGGWRPWGRNQLLFDVIVTLPASQAQPLTLGVIETQLASFSHEFGDLAPNVSLDAAHLLSSNAYVNVKSISAKSFDACTSNSAIDGSFNVADKLHLKTSNGRIDVDVQATNDDWEKPTFIHLKTSNAYITAIASLLASEGAEHLRSKVSGLHLTADTSNARLDIDIPTAPPNSYLTYVGKTSNSRASLALPSPFEGRILGKTSLSQVNFQYDNSSSQDPTGDGRTRHFASKAHGNGFFKIETWWGDDRDEHTKLGSADIITSIGEVSISLL
ncbi:hypothetical protein FRB98_000606 [Tulasnella sp. 332]|nr:hypothetical protein FRB98_000606 [Tulasnella sp. 332]